jgi:transposase
MSKPPYLLTLAQMRRLSPHFPLSHGVPRVDDRRVLSGIVYVIRHGLQWRDAPAAYGPHKTLYNRFIRWSRMGVFDRIFAALAAEGGPPERIMIDSTISRRTAPRPACSKRGFSPPSRANQGRAELQAPRRLRRPGTARRAAAHRRTGQRPPRRGPHAPAPATSPRVDRRPRLR